MLSKKKNQAILHTGTTTWKPNTITSERALARFFDPQVIFQVQKRLHIHRSWRTITRQSITEPTQHTHTQDTELSITSWNPVPLNHGKLERFVTYFDADITTCQGTRLRMRKIPKDGKAEETQSLRLGQNGAQEDIRSFPGAGVLESFWGVQQSCVFLCRLPFERQRLELDKL